MEFVRSHIIVRSQHRYVEFVPTSIILINTFIIVLCDQNNIMTFRSNSDIVLSAIFIVQYCCPVLTQYHNLLDHFGINTGRSGTVSDRIPIDDITR